MAIFLFLTSKLSLLLLNQTKELNLIFAPHQVYDVWNSVIYKGKLLSYSAPSFSFTDMYWIMIGFSYSSKQVGFKEISMSVLNFLSQKIYPGEISRPEIVWNRSYQRKSSI